ncbi:MAG: nickel pincer cofactor biosynthesis protein LarC [Ignavibacteriales bacterium]|nr:nickel pincer cofactor biosynthesis protein LarC [Ignavibacteriales bacterium]
MNTLYFDTFSGISGDMTLGAFVSAGLPLDELANEIRKLKLSGVELQGKHVERSGISAVKIDVLVPQEHHHRHLADIFRIIDASELSGNVKEKAKAIFYELGKAEAKVHNTSLEKIHFHEVGALDAIVDIVGTAICLEKFGIEKCFSSPVRLGSGGFVNAAHGKLPIPVPAVVEILKDYPTELTDIPFELTTPTGAAIVKTLSSGMLSKEKIITKAIGYGAGEREIPNTPNLLRILIGEFSENFDEDSVVTIETNIDNMNSEIYPYVIEKLLANGAHDAYLIPIIMKKGRPGILLSVMANEKDIQKIAEIIFRETTTLGVRIQNVGRKKVFRDARVVETSFGKVKVKVVQLEGKEKLSPEFEECKRIALEKNLPLQEVYAILQQTLNG